VYDSIIYEMRPVSIPSDMLPVIVMSRMVRNAGIASRLFVSLMWRTTPNRKKPATTITGDVAAAGMARNTGAKNKLSAKHKAVTNADTPVLPPSAKPVALST